MYRDVLTNSIMVHDGTQWKPLTNFINDISEFDTKSKKIHNEHPTLQAAWDEYKSLRKLILGEE